MKGRILIAGLATLLSLQGCEGDMWIYELPVPPPKMVLSFALANDMPWQGTVTSTAPILDLYKTDYVNDAEVRLYEDGIYFMTINADQWMEGRYWSDQHLPQPGKRYSVEVKTDKFGMATASYVHPSIVTPASFDYRIIGPSPVWPDADDIEFILEFDDPAGLDFYEVMMQVRDEHGNSLIFNLENPDPSYTDTDIDLAEDSGFILDDKLFEGKTARLVFHGMQLLNGPSEEEMKWKAYIVEIRHFSPEYHDYLVSYVQQLNARNDPYAQPVKIMSNVKNGLGVFAGFTRSVTEYEIN
jgi:hypothetical protein